MVFTHDYSNCLIVYIACVKTDANVAFRAYAHLSIIMTCVSVINVIYEITQNERYNLPVSADA